MMCRFLAWTVERVAVPFSETGEPRKGSRSEGQGQAFGFAPAECEVAVRH